MPELEPIVAGGSEVTVDTKKRQVALPTPILVQSLKKGWCGLMIAHNDHQKKSDPQNTNSKTSAFTKIAQVYGGGVSIYTDTIKSRIGEGRIGPRGLLLLHAHIQTLLGMSTNFRRLGCLGESVPDK